MAGAHSEAHPAAGGHTHPAAPSQARGPGPGQTLYLRKAQDVDKLFVVVVVHAPATLTVEADVRVRGGASSGHRFKPVTRAVKAHLVNRIPLKLRARALRSVKRALRRGKRLRAKVATSARDQKGDVSTVSRSVRLRP